MSDDAQNSAGNSAKRRRGNPDKIVRFRWQPGQSGNPGGRPKRKPITDAYRELLQAVDDQGVTGAQALAWAILRRALTGDVPAAKEITDRVEGTVRQAMDVLFGELSDEQLKDFLKAQYGDAGAGDAGSETPGTGPEGDSAPTEATVPADPDDTSRPADTTQPPDEKTI